MGEFSESAKSAKRFRDGAKKNIAKYCKITSESEDEIYNQLVKDAEVTPLPIPVNFYRTIYNESVRILKCERKIQIDKALVDDNVSFENFYNLLVEYNFGYQDGVNSRDVILQYIKEKIDEDINVGHMLVALDNSDADYFAVWLGNSMETPQPLDTKEELFNALKND